MVPRRREEDLGVAKVWEGKAQKDQSRRGGSEIHLCGLTGWDLAVQLPELTVPFHMTAQSRDSICSMTLTIA